MSVSVLIPVYNTDPMYIFECLQSCFQQTRMAGEVMLVDDGSTNPATVKFLTGIQNGFDPRLRVLSVGQHAGISQALNFGLLNARFDLIARMDADDVMMPHRLERQAHTFENGSADLLGAQVMFFGEQFGGYTSHPSTIDRDMAFNHTDGWFLNHPAVMFHRSSVLELGGYDPAFDGCEDMELWYRMIANGRRLTNINDVLLLHRIHGQQVTAKPRQVNLPLFKSYLKPAARAFG
jgi:glycosyltransferase involved in cell wall biosynthesis